MSLHEEIQLIMKKYAFEFDIKEKQEEVVTSVIAGKDTSACPYPQDSEKSLRYILPPLLLRYRSGKQNTAIVITPLKTIMRDQRVKFASHGIKVAEVVNKEEMGTEDETAIRTGNVDAIFATPEAANAWFGTLTSELLQVRGGGPPFKLQGGGEISEINNLRQEDGKVDNL